MPHFESAARGAWRQAAALAGVRLIDPRDSPSTILQAIGRCKVLLSEALHGVIVADAMRVPWVAIRPLARVHRAKWWDWADTMDLRPRFLGLPASTLSEWAATGALSSFHMTRAWLGPPRTSTGQTNAGPVCRQGRTSICDRQRTPRRSLSTDTTLDRCQSRMLDAVQAMRKQPLRGASREPGRDPRSCLQAGDDSAYQLRPIG